MQALAISAYISIEPIDHHERNELSLFSLFHILSGEFISSLELRNPVAVQYRKIGTFIDDLFPAKPTSTMTISMFAGDVNGDVAAYWWVVCSEQYFKGCRLSKWENMTVAATTLRGCALRWWLWWSHRHPASNWDTFTTDFLWRFKPEWQQILQVLDEEIEPDKHVELTETNQLFQCTQ